MLSIAPSLLKINLKCRAKNIQVLNAVFKEMERFKMKGCTAVSPTVSRAKGGTALGAAGGAASGRQGGGLLRGC